MMSDDDGKKSGDCGSISEPIGHMVSISVSPIYGHDGAETIYDATEGGVGPSVGFRPTTDRYRHGYDMIDWTSGGKA